MVRERFNVEALRGEESVPLRGDVTLGLAREEHETEGKDFHATHGGTPEYWAPAGGAVCLRDATMTFRGVLVVSGLTQREDHALCREALANV
jgi:uncharacterized protein (UPF0303 family)